MIVWLVRKVTEAIVAVIVKLVKLVLLTVSKFKSSVLMEGRDAKPSVSKVMDSFNEEKKSCAEACKRLLSELFENYNNDSLNEQVTKSLGQLATLRKRELQLSRLLRKALMIEDDDKQSENRQLVVPIPLEVWHHVAERIPDSVSWQNFANCNSIIYDSLESKRVTALLPEVLNILYSRDHVGIADIFQCRAVSRGWRIYTDYFLKNKDFRLNFQTDYSACSYNWNTKRYPSTWLYSNLESKKTQEAVTYFAQVRPQTKLELAPLPGGDLVVYEDKLMTRDADIRPFRLSVTNLLEQFGESVHYFSFTSDLDVNYVNRYDTLCTWVSMMPNLRRLNINFCVNVDDTSIESKLSQLTEYVVQHPFPRLEKLVAFQCQNVPISVLNSALIINPQIKMLWVIREESSYFESWEYPTSARNSLTDLFVIVHSGIELEQLEMVNWPLNSLHVESICHAGVEFNINLAKIVNNFGSTLRYLNLELRDSIQVKGPLYLENLTMLKLIFHGKIQVDFILPLKSLQEMSVTILNKDFDASENTDRFIGFANCIETMHLSNVWKLFPKLRKIQVNTHSCRQFFNDKSEFVYCRPEKGTLL